MAYNKKLDYMALMQQAAQAGDFATAAQLEQTRNEKGAGEKIEGFTPTSEFSSYLGKETSKPLGSSAAGSSIDYSTAIRNLMASGGSAEDVGAALQSRVNKALSTPGLSQYAYDDLYKAANKYISQNKAKGSYDSLLDSLINGQKFTYDPKTDPKYQAAATQYITAGKKAMEDTLGDVASMTGGLPSTAAVSAAQGAQNDYNSRLTSMLPDFYDSARGEFQDGFNNKLNLLSALKDDNDTSTDNAYDMAIAMIKTGQVPDSYMLSSAGIDADYASKMANYYAQQAVASASKKSSGGSSRSGSSSSGNGGGSIEDLFNAMKESGTPSTYLSTNYKKYGIAYNTLNSVYKEYTSWLKNSGGGGDEDGEMSAYDVVQDIEALWKKGYTNAQIKAYAKDAHDSGNISDTSYQMYIQYSGR